MKTKTMLAKYGLTVATAAILAGCSSPSTLTQTVDHPSNYRSGSSIDEVNAGYDTFGRKWAEPAPAPAPAPKAPAAPAEPKAARRPRSVAPILRGV